MNYADKYNIPSIYQEDSLSLAINIHKEDLLKKYPLEKLKTDIRRQVERNTRYLRSNADLHLMELKINPFLLLYEMSSRHTKSSVYSILIPSIISQEELELVSIPLGITGRFFKSIYNKYRNGEAFLLEDIISSVKEACTSNLAMEKLLLAIKRLLYMHAIIIKEAETEKP